MKNIITFLSIICLFSCTNPEVNKNLFLNFNSNITLEQYQQLAKENPDLIMSKDATADYYYNLYLKSSYLKTTIHPYFNTKTKGLESLFLHGNTIKREQIEELRTMFLEKYKDPMMSEENTAIRTIQKSSCYNWKTNEKVIRLCIDSLINEVPKMFKNMIEKQGAKDEVSYTYYYEIYYIDNDLKNQDLNKKTKEAI